eukprot:Nitzschia sp. Nitz4//scaffold186_size43309//26910//27404//NITZ4_007321-RA/size43309-processed-gene-0.3-mRNA-1//1//CDS//3329539770//2842//frame0
MFSTNNRSTSSLPDLQYATDSDSCTSSISSLDSQVTRAKQVSFNEKCRVRLTKHLEDYSDKEYFSCWYSAEEKAAIKSDLADDIARMERSEIADEIHTTYRGLESHSKNARRQKLKRRHDAIDSVVGQFRGPDDEEIAETYREHSYTSRIAAYYVGLENQPIAA